MIPELKNLAKWTARLWDVYQKWFGVKMTSADFDAVMAEVKEIWEASHEDPLIEGMAALFMDDLDRRQTYEAGYNSTSV